MNSSGHKTYKLVLFLLMAVCLAASGLYAQGGSTAKSPPKPAATSATAATHATTTPAEAKKAVTPSTPPRSPANLKAGSQPGATKSAATKPAPHAASTYAAKSTPNHTVAHATPRTGSAVRKWRPRPLSGWQRLARLHLQPERVQEIQQALIREGYLHGDANGQWDTATHDAMLHYQLDHGFPATGLPEAKSLMKLGLGSHPLPPDLDHGLVAAPSATATQSVFTVSPAAPPASPAVPSTPDPPQPKNQ